MNLLTLGCQSTVFGSRAGITTAPGTQADKRFIVNLRLQGKMVHFKTAVCTNTKDLLPLGVIKTEFTCKILIYEHQSLLCFIFVS